MSALLGVFGPETETLGPSELRAMLSAMAARGGERIEVWRGDDAVLAVMRHDWEMGVEHAAGDLIVEDEELLVAADAAVYYRSDLLRRLPAAYRLRAGDTPARLVLAAYRAWGPECIERLEGDFAFVIWDRARRRMACGRDFGGARPLFHGRAGDQLVVASAASAVVAHPRWKGGFNLPALAEAAAGLLAAHHETAYGRVESVPAGCVLVSSNGGDPAVAARWTPPPARERDTRPLDEAAEELRALLKDAVRERASGTGGTGVWLSGGWDSTAVYAAGESSLEQEGRGRHLQAVSVSYPPGDPGREDERITEVVERWGGPLDWVDIGDVHLIAGLAAGAATSDGATVHLYEPWNRALAVRSAELGCRVGLTGKGGDELFAGSNVYLTDLARRGRWGTLLEEWRARGRPSRRDFARQVLEPLMPGPARALLARLEGRRDARPNPFERAIAPWIRRDFAVASSLAERQRHTPVPSGEGLAGAELTWFLTHPYIAQVHAWVVGFGVESGTEMRSPLGDGRLVEFVARRPVSDRVAGGETKRLLRRSMSGLLPAEVLAPRAKRTGVTTGFLEREVRDHARGVFGRAFREPLLAELGIVDAAALRAACDDFQASARPSLAANLLYTLHAELWLRARAGAHEAPKADLAVGVQDLFSQVERPWGPYSRRESDPGITEEGGFPCTRNRRWNASERCAS